MSRLGKASVAVICLVAILEMVSPASAMWLMKWKDTIEGEHKAVADCSRSPKGQSVDWIRQNCKAVAPDVAKNAGELEVIDLGVVQTGPAGLLNK
jgi:hypothetical protein